MEEKIRNSETKQFKMVIPNTLNSHETFFGGIAMQWMDEVAFITATRFLREKVVTVSVEKVKFLLPIKMGSILEISGKVLNISAVRLEVAVEIYVEQMFEEKREKAVSANFFFVAVNENSKPKRIRF